MEDDRKRGARTLYKIAVDDVDEITFVEESPSITVEEAWEMLNGQWHLTGAPIEGGMPEYADGLYYVIDTELSR